MKTAEVSPWVEVHVDRISPYTVKTQRLDTKGDFYKSTKIINDKRLGLPHVWFYQLVL